MEKESCTFYPGCPPCFGLCDTEHAPYAMEDNKACDGCPICRAEKAKGTILLETNRVDAVFDQLYKDGKIKEEAISILYIEKIISRNAFHKMKDVKSAKTFTTINPCKTCNCCKIDDVHKPSMLDENGQPGCFGKHTFPFACDDAGRKACPHCKKRQKEVPG